MDTLVSKMERLMKAYDGTHAKYKHSPITVDLVTYVDMMFQIMGVDLDFERYVKMKPEERVQFLREQKLKRLNSEI